MAEAQQHIVLGGSRDGLSCILKGTMPIDGRNVAIKRVITKNADKCEVERLIDLSKRKQHDNVIRYFLFIEDDPYSFIYLELCSGTLENFVEDYKTFKTSGLDDKTAIKHIANGLEHIHDNNIYHLDLKPSNILITGDKQKRLVLADFEVSKKVERGKESIRTRTFLGTRGWIAPEIEFDCECEKRITRKADIFSFGLLVYYIVTRGMHAFEDRYNHKNGAERLDEAQLKIKNHGNDNSKVLSLGKIHNILAKDLLSHLLEKTPDLRPDARDVVKHPFFWTTYEQCKFYRQVGDCTEHISSTDRRLNSPRRLQQRLDQDKQRVIYGNWLANLKPSVKQSLTAYIKGISQSAGKHTWQLVRVIRNVFAHYCERNPNANIMGPLPSYDAKADRELTLFDSLTKNFPELFLHTYHAVLPWRDDDKFQAFYPECDFPKFQELQNDHKSTFGNNGDFLEIFAQERYTVPKRRGESSPHIADLCIKENNLIIVDKRSKSLVMMSKAGNSCGVMEEIKDLSCPTSVTYNKREDQGWKREEIILSEPKQNRIKIFDCATNVTTIVTEANRRKLCEPRGVAVNSKGQIVVVDTGNRRLVMLDRHGKFEAGVEDPGPESIEDYMALAFDKHDNAYVTDRVKQSVHVFSKSGHFVRSIGPKLSHDHAFTECWGIAIYGEYMVVTDYYENKVHVLTTAGEHMCCLGKINRPTGITHDENGVFYVCETGENKIVKLELQLMSFPTPKVNSIRQNDVRLKKKAETNAEHS